MTITPENKLDYFGNASVVFVPVTGISLPSTFTMNAGTSYNDFKPTFTPSNASVQNVTWTTSNNSVVNYMSFTDGRQIFIANSPGTATLIATTQDGGYTATLTATVEPDDANNKNVTWSSSDDSVAKVTTSGKVTAVGAGTATITVTTEDGGKTATCAVTVQPLYQLNEPKSQTKWYKGSTDGTTFTFNNQVDDTKTYTNFDSYTGDKVFVDGNAVNDYDAASGSLILTLKAAYLETLGGGSHIMRVRFTDGDVTADFTVRVKSGGTTYNSPYTGEGDGMIAANVVLLAIVAAGAAYGLRKRHCSQSL